MIKVRNLLTDAYNTAANQYEIIDDIARTVTFQSYDSIIATIDRINQTITLYPAWDYSRTTDKYRNKFFKENYFAELATTEALRKALKAGKLEREYFTYTVQMAAE